MKRLIKAMPFFLTALLIAACAADISADDKIRYDGQIRLRSELDLKSLNPSRHARNFNDLRTRVGFKFQPSDVVFAYIQFQDSRRLGGPDSGELTSTDNVDIHQAYFVIENAIIPCLYIKGGRFELNYGNQRVFGSAGWHNIGRSWEGGLFSYRNEALQIDLFGLKKMELGDSTYNRDFDIFGLYGKIKKAYLDLFFFYELDADSNGYVQEKLKRFNVGGYYSSSYDNFDFTMQGGFQFGEIPRDTIPDSLVQDISAFMAAGELGYSFGTRTNARIAIGVDYTSGDDGSDSAKFKAYRNAYYTGHKFRGYMDYFLGSPEHGLIDAMLRGKVGINPQWLFKGDLHYFKAAEDYLSKADGMTMTGNIGYEFDFTVVNKSVAGAAFTGGVSLFFADKHFAEAGDNRKTGIWSYLMTTINF